MNIALLILLFACHYICDYSHLSMDFMLKAKRIGKPLHPIFLHALVHTVAMSVVVIFFASDVKVFSIVMVLQLLSHFLIDVLKGKLNVWLPIVSNPANKSHWYIFGADQLLHQLVIVIMYAIITN